MNIVGIIQTRKPYAAVEKNINAVINIITRNQDIIRNGWKRIKINLGLDKRKHSYIYTMSYIIIV